MTGLPSSRHWTHGLWSALVCMLFVWAAVSEVLDIGYWKRHRTLNYDIETYYHYLPATIIHGDPLDLGYVAALDSLSLHPGEGQKQHGVRSYPSTGHHVLKVTCGVAIMELPFFLLAHGYCVVFEPAIADGYSAPYQLMVSLSAICSTFLGMLVLVTFLRRHTHDRAIACALLILTLGTNLFFYSTVDSGMPHSYLFLLFCIVLERSDPWHYRPAMNKAVAIGLALGMIALIRPVDVLVGVLPLLWPIAQGGLSKWHLSRSHGGQLVVLCLCAALPILPQIAYWKAATGQWLYWSYEGEGFNWSDPHIIDGLFGFRKGWFVYSPLVLLGFIGLLMMMLRPKWRALAWPVLVYFTLAFYITFSWRSWWYGGGFGCRPMVEALALLALPMAVLAQDLLERNKTLLVAFALVLLAGIHLNRFQQDQYEQTIIHWDSMTRERYWEVWGHAHWDGLKEFP